MAKYVITTNGANDVVNVAHMAAAMNDAVVLIKKLLDKPKSTVRFVGFLPIVARRLRTIIGNSHPKIVVMTSRWPAGRLTNYKLLNRGIDMHHDLVEDFIEENLVNHIDKEVASNNLKSVYGEIMPSLIVYMNTLDCEISIMEAKRIGVMTMGLLTTASKHANLLDYVIPIGGYSLIDSKVVFRSMLRARFERAVHNPFAGIHKVGEIQPFVAKGNPYWLGDYWHSRARKAIRSESRSEATMNSLDMVLVLGDDEMRNYETERGDMLFDLEFSYDVGVYTDYKILEPQGILFYSRREFLQSPKHTTLSGESIAYVEYRASEDLVDLLDFPRLTDFEEEREEFDTTAIMTLEFHSL